MRAGLSFLPSSWSGRPGSRRRISSRNLDGLESTRINQLIVLPTLQTTRDENIFVMGDCAACAWASHPGRYVPPRAQAAHQQATHLVKQIKRRLGGTPLQPWRYRDFGSLVSLGEYSTVGNLMGGLIGGNLWIEGLFARLMYRSLYKMHEYLAARSDKGDARYAGPTDHAAHRAAREVALRRAR